MPAATAEAPREGHVRMLDGVKVLLQEMQGSIEARLDRYEDVLSCLITQQQRLETWLRQRPPSRFGGPAEESSFVHSRTSMPPLEERSSQITVLSSCPVEEGITSRTRLSQKASEGGILAKAYHRGSDVILPSRPPANTAPMDEPLPEVDLFASDELRKAPTRKQVYWVRHVLKAVKEPSFDIGCGIMVLLNTVLIGAETEYMALHMGETHVGFVFAQLSLNLWFTLELALRILADSCRFLTSEEWKWNVFDSVLVCFSIVDVVQVTVMRTEGMVVTGRLLRILRLSRVVRTLRLCRSLNYIHQFRKMVYSLQASITTLMWSLLLLFFVMFAFSVMFVQGVVEYLGSDPSEGPAETALKSNYGNVLTACRTLYMAISNGQSWSILLEPLEGLDDSVFIVLFLLYIFISTCGVLNVISAVFVESAMASAAHYKDLRIYESRKAKTELVRHMREVFKQIDEDGSGEISFEEMDHFLTDPQLKMYVESLEVTVEDTAMLFKLMDLDDSGVVDIDEFCSGLMRLQGDARSFDMHLLIFEMSKLQTRWDKFVSYVEFMLEEVLDSTVSPQQRKSAWSRVAQWRYANARMSRTNSSYYFSSDLKPKWGDTKKERAQQRGQERGQHWPDTRQENI